MNAWDRQEDEPTRWFDRFERYRAAGPARTLEGVWRSEATSSKAKRPSSSWYEAADRWRWHARAAAWDDAQRGKARVAEENDLAERRKAWIAQAQALQGKAAERLLQMEAVELSARDVLAFFGEGLRLELLARGEAESITEDRGKGEQVVIYVPSNGREASGDPAPADSGTVPREPG